MSSETRARGPPAVCTLPRRGPQGSPIPPTPRRALLSRWDPFPPPFEKRGEETVWGLSKGAELEGVSPVSWVRTSWDLLARSPPNPNLSTTSTPTP